MFQVSRQISNEQSGNLSIYETKSSELQEVLGAPTKCRTRNFAKLAAMKSMAAPGRSMIEDSKRAAQFAMGRIYQQLRYYSTVEKQISPSSLPHDYQYDDAKPHQAVEANTMFGAKIDLAEHRRISAVQCLRRLDDIGRTIPLLPG